jgi:quercetin dioxygenase-like cupin family protein
MPAPLHLVVARKEMRTGALGVFEGHARGLSRTMLLDREAGSVHVGYAISELAPGGAIDRSLHAFEKTIYVLSGELLLERDGMLIRLTKDDYALVSTGTPHALRNAAKEAVQWVEVSTPQPKPVGGWRDTFFVETLDWGRLSDAPPSGDPRRKLLGHHDGSMPPSADMHGDLRGFSIRYFLDRDFGAVHLNMFTVEFAKGGICNHHDHPFEEAYLVLDGDVDIVFDGRSYTLQRGDFAWTAVGSRHAFFPVEGRPVRWLEIQAPQPPTQGGMRWHSRWEELARLIDGETKVKKSA